jgi:hypothetical protein
MQLIWGTQMQYVAARVHVTQLQGYVFAILGILVICAKKHYALTIVQEKVNA